MSGVDFEAIKTPAWARAIGRRLAADGWSWDELRRVVGRATAERLLHGREWTAATFESVMNSDGLLTADEVESLTAWSARTASRTEDNRRVLLISDMHQPWTHPDAFRFLAALAKKYRPTRVICLGDEVDAHALSFHTHDPDLPSAGDELERAVAALRPLFKLFPAMDIIESNHGSLAYRKAKEHGIPRKYIRDYAEVLRAPPEWRWHPELRIRVPGGNEVLLHHGISSNVTNVVKQRGMCVVQGHYHTTFKLEYVGNPNHLLWGLQLGCLIDPPALAFEYDKLQLQRPIIGTGLILDGLPHLAPMVLKRGGRWTGVVP